MRQNSAQSHANSGAKGVSLCGLRERVALDVQESEFWGGKRQRSTGRAAERRRRTEPLYMGSSPPVYSKRFIFQKGM